MSPPGGRRLACLYWTSLPYSTLHMECYWRAKEIVHGHKVVVIVYEQKYRSTVNTQYLRLLVQLYPKDHVLVQYSGTYLNIVPHTRAARGSTVVPYHHSSVLPYHHTAVLPYQHSAVLPYHHTAVLLYYCNTILNCCNNIFPNYYITIVIYLTTHYQGLLLY